MIIENLIHRNENKMSEEIFKSFDEFLRICFPKKYIEEIYKLEPKEAGRRIAEEIWRNVKKQLTIQSNKC